MEEENPINTANSELSAHATRNALIELKRHFKAELDKSGFNPDLKFHNERACKFINWVLQKNSKAHLNDIDAMLKRNKSGTINSRHALGIINKIIHISFEKNLDFLSAIGWVEADERKKKIWDS